MAEQHCYHVSHVTSIYHDILCWTFFKSLFFLSFDISYYYYFASDTSARYASTPNAFIFSLRNKEGLEPFKSMVRRPHFAIKSSWDTGPRFGIGHDILIDDHANDPSEDSFSYSSFGYAYTVPSGVKDASTLLAGTWKFIPGDWEVFYLE